MASGLPVRVSKVSIAASIVLLLVAMMLPVCHIHPLLDRAAPDHCTICVSLHVAAPLGAHAPLQAAPLLRAEQVVIAPIQFQPDRTPRFAASRAPPLPAC